MPLLELPFPTQCVNRHIFKRVVFKVHCYSLFEIWIVSQFTLLTSQNSWNDDSEQIKSKGFTVNFYIAIILILKGRRTCNQEQILDEAVKAKWFRPSTGEKTSTGNNHEDNIEIIQKWFTRTFLACVSLYKLSPAQLYLCIVLYQLAQQ